MKHIIIIITISYCCCSCSRKNDFSLIQFKQFPYELTLSDQEVQTPNILNMVGEMELLDSALITLNLKSDTFFNVFSLPQLKYTGSFISKGNGPQEEIAIDPYFRHTENNQFLYHTSNAVKISVFIENEMKILEKIYLPSELMNFNQIFKFGDSICGQDIYSKDSKEFILYNPKNKKLISFGPDFPNINRNVPSNIKTRLFAKIVAIKPDKSRFVSAYDKFPIIRIYSKKGNLEIESRYNNHQKFPEAFIEKNPSPESLSQIMQTYRKIKVTNKYIYALYIGKTNKELKKEGKGLNDVSNEIHVWDWNGKPVSRILLNKSVFSFCVSKDDKYLICSSLNSINKLFKYSLEYGFGH